MTENTTTLNGVEFDNNDLRDALEQYLDGNDCVTVGNVVVMDDTFNDDDVYVGQVGEGRVYYDDAEDLLNLVEEDIKDDFVTYVDELTSERPEHEVVEGFGTTSEHVNIRDTQNNCFTGSVTKPLCDDDGVRITCIDMYDDELRIEVQDMRDE